MYGPELILDLHKCEITTFRKNSIKNYFKQLCDLIDMERCKLVFWNDQWWRKWFLPWTCSTEPHTEGITAIQFILTSNITIHTLVQLKQVHINIFSCKDFDPESVKSFTEYWFGGETVQDLLIKRI